MSNSSREEQPLPRPIIMRDLIAEVFASRARSHHGSWQNSME